MPKKPTRAETAAKSRAEKAQAKKYKKQEEEQSNARAEAISAARVKSIAYIGSNPFPVEKETSKFIQTMVNYPACASLIFMGHGGKYTEFNLTNPCLIPFYVLSLFASYSSGFSTFARTAHDSQENLQYHRMGKTFALNNVHELLQQHNKTQPLTIKSLFKAMETDQCIKKINVYQHRAMAAEYKLILECAKTAGRDPNKVGHYTGGNNSNQILYLCIGHMFNNSLVHDDFCGLFLKLYYYETLGIWTSSMNDNYNPDSPATKNSIKFREDPRKKTPVREIAGQPNTVVSDLLDALLADLSSIEVLKKVKDMTRPLLILLMKILIARNVLFVSSCSGTPNQDTKSKITVIGTRIPYDYLHLNDENILSIGLCKIPPAPATATEAPEAPAPEAPAPEAPATYKTLGDVETKIYRLTTEDTFFLMHFLSIISNQEIPENRPTLERIKTIMDQLSTAITNLLQQKTQLPQDSYEQQTLLLTTLSIRLMNDSIMSNAYYTRRVMGFIQSACRPANTPAEEEKVKPASPFSQEMTMQVSNDEICLPVQPIKTPPSISENILDNSFLLNQMKETLNLTYVTKIPQVEIYDPIKDTKVGVDLVRNDIQMNNFIVLNLPPIPVDKSRMPTLEQMPPIFDNDDIRTWFDNFEEKRTEILTMFKEVDTRNGIRQRIVGLEELMPYYNNAENYNNVEIAPLIEEAQAQAQMYSEKAPAQVRYGGRNKKTHKRRNTKTCKRIKRSKRSKTHNKTCKRKNKRSKRNKRKQ